MNLCSICLKQLLDGDRVVSTVDGTFRQVTNITHSLDVWDELEVRHLDCHYLGFWALRWLWLTQWVEERLHWKI